LEIGRYFPMLGKTDRRLTSKGKTMNFQIDLSGPVTATSEPAC
jgi:hypothetical protein